MKAFVSVLCAGLLVASVALAQCPGGNCQGGQCQAQWRAPGVNVQVDVNRPTPAWRYEAAIGYRQAVVRIHSLDSDSGRIKHWSKGSGVLVKWGGKIVVLTARHVVKDTKDLIVELFTRKTHRAHVVCCDTTWDCAVLELDTKPEGVEAAEPAYGEDATPKKGEQLESAGYGPDGKLACNTGVFIDYRRSTRVLNGPDDWILISGHARGGDSGGPVFNARGRLVGVLWGTDGSEVICVQAGRLHVLLNEAAKQYEQKADGERQLVPVIFPRDRKPTPPMEGPPQPRRAIPIPGPEPYVLPYRNDQDSVNKATDARIAELTKLMLAQQEQQNRPIPAPTPVAPEKPAPAESPRSPLIDGLCILGAVILGFVCYFAVPKGD